MVPQIVHNSSGRRVLYRSASQYLLATNESESKFRVNALHGISAEKTYVQCSAFIEGALWYSLGSVTGVEKTLLRRDTQVVESIASRTEGCAIFSWRHRVLWVYVRQHQLSVTTIDDPMIHTTTHVINSESPDFLAAAAMQNDMMAVAVGNYTGGGEILVYDAQMRLHQKVTTPHRPYDLVYGGLGLTDVLVVFSDPGEVLYGRLDTRDGKWTTESVSHKFYITADLGIVYTQHDGPVIFETRHSFGLNAMKLHRRHERGWTSEDLGSGDGEIGESEGIPWLVWLDGRDLFALDLRH